MGWKELEHKRVLVVNKDSYRNKSQVEEFKILEVSPSNKFVKCQNINGNKFWRHADDITVIEILSVIEKAGQ